MTASWQARAIAPGTSCGANRLVDPDGVLAREAVQLAGEERLGARDGAGPAGRRATTSGARLTRAVASAPTAFPSPAVVCRIASAGSPRPIAQPVAMPTTELSCSAEHEAEVVRQVGEQPDLGRPGVREDRRQPVLAPDVERRLADGLRRPRAHRLHKSFDFFDPGESMTRMTAA